MGWYNYANHKNGLTCATGPKNAKYLRLPPIPLKMSLVYNMILFALLLSIASDKKPTEKHTLLKSKLLHVRNHSIIWLYIPNTSILKCINYVMFISLHIIITRTLFWQFCFVSDSQILEGIQLWLLFFFLSLSPCYFDKKQANAERELISIWTVHIHRRLY